MSTVVIDPHASLTDRIDHNVVYSRNVSHAFMLLRARRASRRVIDTLWLSWDLSCPDQGRGGGDDASQVVSMLAESARGRKAVPDQQNHRCHSQRRTTASGD